MMDVRAAPLPQPKRTHMTNVLNSIPAPMKIREELERMVLNDLIGPVSGPDEEIAEPSVRDRYLVGMLAPRGQKGDKRAKGGERAKRG